MPTKHYIVLGQRGISTPVGVHQAPFSVSADERMRHMYVVGMTGMGKTTLLEHMVVQDMHAGQGVTYLDFHGDSVRRLLDYVPRWRVNDVVYVNPSDVARPIGFNVTESVPKDQEHETAKHLTAAFRNLFAYSWGPQLEYILLHDLWAHVELPGGTLLGVYRALIDRDYQRWVARKAKDPVLKLFWNAFDENQERWKREAVMPIVNKVGQVVSSPLMRNMVGSVRSTMDFQDVMDNRRIMLVNLSKGLLDETTANLLGSLIVSRLQATAMGRAKVAERRRVDHYVYIDEFQNLSTRAFADILSEARKYRLGLTLAHQYIEQLSEEVRDAVLGNVGTMVTFRVGYQDAEVLEKAYGRRFPARSLTELEAGEVVARVPGENGGEPFRGSTRMGDGERHPLEGYWWGRGGSVVKRSRQIYGGRRKVREGKIERFLEGRETEGKRNNRRPALSHARLRRSVR